MNLSIPDYQLVAMIEFLVFVADLARAEASALDAALEHFNGMADLYDAADLRADTLECADYLAQVLGYPDATMDPDAVRADYEACR